MEKEIQPIAMPGIHSRFYPFLLAVLERYPNPHILDLGTGRGAMIERLWNDGYQDLKACDLDPALFQFDHIVCEKADITQELAYPDRWFDVIIAVELLEHVNNHETFFSECRRVLKRGGTLICTTPNILSLKSRLRFFLSGFFYSFSPLNYQRQDGMQHVSSLTPDQANYLGQKHGFSSLEISSDKWQNTSLLLSPSLFLIWCYCHLKRINFSRHNSKHLLFGRVLFLLFR